MPLIKPNQHLTNQKLADHFGANLVPSFLVWSKNTSSLAVSKKFKYFNADDLIEGTSF